MNFATSIMEEMTKYLKDINQMFGHFATEPYGVRKLTEKEELERFRTLTPDKLIEMIQKEGVEKTIKWLARMEQKEKKYAS